MAFLSDYYGSDKVAMLTILKLYLQETPKDIASITGYLNSDNSLAAKEATHKMKTNVAMLGIADPADFITSVHFLSATEKVPEEIKLKFNAFRNEVLAALQEIERDYFS